ncbi:small ribosomal subunit protein uS17m [Procambarus clarkii]|uniref:small ribosomal subunit protein uS17m n=1 Tax=Procambarus clarkii TaxID=6728 RepID=UPI001E6758D5|nr:28S ribosomal protein S17, mitochondrial-like [Procambarus clarkii]
MASQVAKRYFLIGQCISHNIQNAARVRVKRMEFDSNLNMYFPCDTHYYAHDPEKVCKEGDIVLIKELPEKMTKDITHSLIKMVYKFGDVTDPITGKKVIMNKYRDQIKERIKMFGVAEDGKGGFNYEEAPDRGWQEGKRDFTHKVGYMKWHEFPPGHPLHNDPVAT